ncbi:MAG: hypothetical protein LKG21_06770 [Ruminococcus sp.]|jgi:hypothetical protein|nr:hypothetical protein [Ruminococcus sp.]
MRNANRNNIARIIDRTVYTAIKNNLGGENSLSFRLLSDAFSEKINTAVCNEFGVTDTANIPKESVIEAIIFVLSVKPSEDIIQLSKKFENEFQEFIYHFVEDMPKDTPAYQQLINDYIANLPDSTSAIDDNDIGCLESEMERAIEAYLYSVRHSKFYKYLYSLCTDELDEDFSKEFCVDNISELPAEKFIEAMQFVGEWTPSYETLCKISELEPYKIKVKTAK